MKRKIYKTKPLIAVGVFLIVFLPIYSCNEIENKTHLTEHGDEKRHSHTENENTVTLTQAQLQAIGLEYGQIEKKELTNVIKANGFLKVPNQNKAQASSLYAGQIKSLKVQSGDFVGKGQTIAILENPNQILVQEQYLTTLGQIKISETEVKRQTELYEGNAGALKNLQYAQSQLRTLQTQKASLAKQLQLMGINPATVSSKNLQSTQKVKAPIAGVISTVLVDIGTYVDPTFTIAEIVDNQNLHLDLDIYEKDLPQISKGQVIHFTLTNNPVREYDAEIFSIGSTFEDLSKAVPVHAQVKGDKRGLIDGMNVVALISIGKNTVPAVPTEAIASIGAEDFVFIQKSKSSGSPDKGHEEEVLFEKIPVVQGATDIGYTEITALREIPEGTKIVTKGAFFIMAKFNDSAQDSHAH